MARLIKLEATAKHPSRTAGEVYSVKAPQAMLDLHKRWARGTRKPVVVTTADLRPEPIVEPEPEVVPEVAAEPAEEAVPQKRKYKRRDLTAE